jgi:acyl-CoA thioesterase-1
MKALSCLVALAAALCACSRGGAGEPRSAAAAEVTPASAPAASAPITEPTASSGRPRIVFLGDSLTAGYGLETQQSVPSLVQAQLDEEGYAYEVVNAGVSGDTSAGGLRRLEWSLDGDVRVLVIELGANDGLRGLPAADLKKNLTQVIETAQARGIKVLLTGMEAPPNYGPSYTSEFRQVYRDLAKTPNVTFMPFYLEGVAGKPELNIRDGIHPNPQGARIVEKNVWRALQPLLDKRSTQ